MELMQLNTARRGTAYKRGKPSIDIAEVRRLSGEGELGPSAIARQPGIGRASVYRPLGKQANGGANADQG